MGFWLYTFVCSCGHHARWIRVGYTDNRQILIQWKCTACHGTASRVMSVEEFFKDIDAKNVQFDKQFLKDMCIAEGAD